MINKSFEAYKIKREIKRSGIECDVKRNTVNDFGEPSNEEEIVGKLKGLYHEENSKIQLTTGETTQYRNKKIPRILALFEDVTLLGLKVKDVVVINNKSFEVTGCTNIQEWNLIMDISLEEVDNGELCV